jgi:hypothetical protein
MKTQLLEDIGQSAGLSLVPSKTADDAKADKQVQNGAPAGKAAPSRPRFGGAWRQKPAGEPPVATTQQPDRQPVPLELHSLIEEIAALEAQYVPPGAGHAPVIAPAEPQHALGTSAAEPPHGPAVPAVEPTLAANRTHSAPPPQDPVFDFAAPSPALQAADPFTPAPTGLARSGRRYLLWGACALSGALLILGGRWLYEGRNDTRPLVSSAGEAKEAPQADQVLKRPAIAAKQLTPQPDGEVRVTPAVPASPSAAAPPLVMLEPDPPAATKGKQSLPAGRTEFRKPPKREQAADQGPASPVPKPSARKAREQTRTAAVPASERREREPAPPYARASAIAKETPSEQDTTMTATLRACREHGYHAAQCIKRACSLTKYGFACRAR